MEKAKEDTNKVNLLNRLCTKLLNIGNYNEVISNAKKSAKLGRKLAFQKGVAISESKMAIAYTMQGNYPEALSHNLSALDLFQKLGREKDRLAVNANIGIIYFYQKNYGATIKIYLQDLDIRKRQQEKEKIATAYLWLGNAYLMQNNYSKALEYYFDSKKTYEELGLKQGIAWAFHNLGNVYNLQKDHLKALENYENSLAIRIEISDEIGTIASYINIGEAYFQLRDYHKSRDYLNKALQGSKSASVNEYIMNCYANLSAIDSAENNFKQALDYYKLFVLYKDSLINEENTKKTVRLEMQYEFDKKEEAARLDQEGKDALAVAEKKKQNIILIAISGFGLLVLGFALFAYRSFLQKKKTNIEISKQKELIEEKQKEILDSIRYARRIQASLLTNEKYIAKNLDRLMN